MSPTLPRTVLDELERAAKDPAVLELVRHVRTCSGCSYSLDGVSYCKDGEVLAGRAGLSLLSRFLGSDDPPVRNPLAGQARSGGKP